MGKIAKSLKRDRKIRVDGDGDVVVEEGGEW